MSAGKLVYRGGKINSLVPHTSRGASGRLCLARRRVRRLPAKLNQYPHKWARWCWHTPRARQRDQHTLENLASYLHDPPMARLLRERELAS